MRLNLFHDVEFAATIERSTPTASGYSLSGPLDGVPFGRVVLVVNGKHTVGRVYTPEGVYAIRTTGAMQTVERVEPEPLRCEAVTPPDDEGLLPHSIRPDDGVGALASKRGTTPAAKHSGSADRPGRLLSGKAAADDGDVVDEPSSEPDGPADAVRHLTEVRQILTNVRAGADADPCRYELTGDDGVLAATGATYRVHLETGPDCAWTASGGEWVESVLEASGTGSGEIAFTVTANDGWERPVELLVSGKLHARRQAGSRPITPVCERSHEVLGILMVLHPDWNTQSSCRHLNLDAAYVASLRHLSLPGNDIYNYNDSIDGSELRLGDFDGLTGLVHLRFRNVESLPADLFSGLIGLKVLNFRNRSGRNTTLASIEPGAFRGLPGLVELSIGGHRVGVFKAGTFEGLPRLRELLVWGRYDRAPDNHTPSTTFEPGAFAGLSDLRLLRILRHRVASLEAGVFDDLGRLQVLRMRRNELRSLASGVFDGMSDLVELELQLNLLTTLPSGVFDDLWGANCY